MSADGHGTKRVETLPKISIAWVECTNERYRRQTTDGREFSFAKNVTISDRFICFISTVKQLAALTAIVLRARLKRSSTFWHFWQKCIRWHGLKIFWYRNDLAPLLRCTWNDLGPSYTALALAPVDLPHDLSDLKMTWLPWCPGAATVPDPYPSRPACTSNLICAGRGE